MYCEGLGFKEVGSFDDHDGFDGRMVATHGYVTTWSLLSTAARRCLGNCFSRQSLVFEIDKKQWRESCEAMTKGFQKNAYNPYWDRLGKSLKT